MAKVAKKTMKRMAKRQRITIPKRVSIKQSPMPSRLAACTAGYLRAVANPFTASGVCLPIGDALPSQKYSTRLRGSAFVGTAGVGFIATTPSPCSDRNIIHSSQTGYALGSGAAIPIVGSGGTQVQVNTDGPTTAAILASQAFDSWKFVMHGFRIRYVGTNDNLSGTVTLWEDNEDYQVIGMTPDSIRSKADAKSFPVSRNWTKIVLASSDTRLQNFTILPDYASVLMNVVLTTARFPLGIIMTGVPGNEFEYEVIHHFEFRSQGRTSLYTRSTIDPVAGQAAVNGAENLSANQGDFQTLAINTLENVRKGATVLGNGMSFFNSVANAITGYNQIAEPGSGQNVFGARTNFGRRGRGGFQIMDVD